MQWDVPLLDGYRAVFLDNMRREKGVGGFWSLVNPGIIAELRRHRYDAIWIHGYNYATHLLGYLAARCLGIPVFTRGDTNLLILKKRPKLRSLLHGLAMRLYYAQCGACLAIGLRNSEP